MPNSNSAKKRLRQNVARRLRNRSVKADLKTQIRKVRDAVEGNELDKAEAEYRVAAKKLDRAGAHSVIHKNAASRKKSRLQHLIKKAKQAD